LAGQSGWQEKYCPPTGFKPWTVQLGATHYNDCYPAAKKPSMIG